MVELLWIIVILLLMCSGYFSGSETALFSLPQTKVKAYRSSKDSTKRLIGHLLRRPKDLLVTVFMLNTLVNILVQNVTSHAVGEESDWLMKVALPFFLLLFLGEIVPKYTGLLKNERVAYLSAPSINFLQNNLKKIREWTVSATAPVSRALFFFLKHDKEISYEELVHVLKESEKEGVLIPHETELVRGYLNLQDLSTKEVMCPREEVVFFDINDPLKKLTHLFVDEKISRLPVCKGDLQETLGIIDAHDFFLIQNQLQDPKFDLRNCLKKPFYVPETTPAKILLKRLTEKQQELALVVDEYGAISGLVTNEDLVEVIVGEIRDMRDKTQLYTQPAPGELICSGRLELLEFNQLFEVLLKSPNNMVTIGGWLTERAGIIPKNGSSFEFDGFLFQILAADSTRISRLYIRKMEDADDS